MEAKTYYGPHDTRSIVTAMPDGTYQALEPLSMRMRTMSAAEFAEFKSGSMWRRYGNGENARVLREFKMIADPQVGDEPGVEREYALWHSLSKPHVIIQTPKADWDDFVTEIMK